MASILTYLNNILQAVYGKDVRQSIHDGIQAINSEVESTTSRQNDLETVFDNLVINAGSSNAEIVAARGTKTDLDSRLDDIETKQNYNAKNYRPDFELIAHRGFAGLYPENTVYAAKRAILEGACPECDVSITSDGYPVLMHDTTVDRTTNGTGTITTLTWAYVSGLDAGSDFASHYAGLHVPLFYDYLKVCRNAKHIYPEIKNIRVGQEQADIQSIVNMVIGLGLEDKCTLQSFNYTDVISYIRAVSKKIRVGCLVGADQNTFNALLPTVAADSNSMMLIITNLATEANLTACRNAGVEVGVWVSDSINSVQSLIDLGYTKIMSNYNVKGVR